MTNLINAKECKSIEEIRNQIDLIDEELVKLFAKRTEYVKEIVKYKEKNSDAIIARERKMHVIQQRSGWAEELGLDREAYAQIFTILIEHNISLEMNLIENK